MLLRKREVRACIPVLAGIHRKFFGSIRLSQAGISRVMVLGLMLKFGQVSGLGGGLDRVISVKSLGVVR